MDSLIEIARGMVPDKFTIARVRARSDDSSKYIVQVSGRDVDFLATAEERLSVGDDVLVLLEPSVHSPVILALSPWRACYQVVPSTNDGEPWTVADFDGLDGAVSGNEDVVANLAAAHARSHSMTSTADHSDVSGVADDAQLLSFDGDGWVSVGVTITLDGGTR